MLVSMSSGCNVMSLALLSSHGPDSAEAKKVA